MAKSSIDINGYRKQTANPISRTGVFPYYGKQIDFDGSLCLEPDRIYWVLRSEMELFDAEAMNSFNGIPIIVGHTMLGEGFASPEKRTPDGCIYNVRRSLDTPDQLIADFTIYTKRMQDILKEGKIRELSLGYRCQYVPETGVYNGQAYEFKQVHLRGNHLALVEHGRCGSSVCVCDEALPITFDSLPEGIQNMENQDEKKDAKKVSGKLAEVLKNGTEDDCQAILDFCDLSKEDKAKALEFIKGKKAEPKTPAQDAKAKDGAVPPPPPPDAKKEEPTATATPAATPTAEPKKEEPAATPTATPAPEPKKEEPQAATPAPAAPSATAEPPKAEGEDCKGKKEGKTEDGIVHDKDCHDPACKGECVKKSEKKDEPKAQATDTASTVTQPTAQVPKAALEAEPKKEEPKAEVKEEPKKEEPKAPTADAGTEPKKEEAKTEPPKAEPKKEEPAKTEPPKEEPKKEEPKKEEPKAEPPKAEPSKETPKAEDAKAEPKKEEPKVEKKDEGNKSEEPKTTTCDSAAQYKAFAEEYSRAQKLADSVREATGETFDSATMREVDVARFAATKIEALAFAADQADAVVLGAVKAHLNTLASVKTAAKPKTFQVAEDNNVTPAPKTTSAKKLAEFLAE